MKNCAHITTARGSNVGLGRLLWNARRNEVLHTSERGRGINNARYKQADKGGAFVGVGNSQVCERKRERGLVVCFSLLSACFPSSVNGFFYLNNQTGNGNEELYSETLVQINIFVIISKSAFDSAFS